MKFTNILHTTGCHGESQVAAGVAGGGWSLSVKEKKWGRGMGR